MYIYAVKLVVKEKSALNSCKQRAQSQNMWIRKVLFEVWKDRLYSIIIHHLPTEQLLTCQAAGFHEHDDGHIVL